MPVSVLHLLYRNTKEKGENAPYDLAVECTKSTTPSLGKDHQRATEVLRLHPEASSLPIYTLVIQIDGLGSLDLFKIFTSDTVILADETPHMVKVWWF